MPTVIIPQSVKLDQELVSRIKQLAESKKRSAHWVMREAISAYVEHEEQVQRLNQENIDAWNAFQKNGLHVTANEVTAWLDSWGADEVKAAPKCHK